MFLIKNIRDIARDIARDIVKLSINAIIYFI